MQMMEGFKDLLGLPRIQRTIDTTEIHIQKPKSNVIIANYYSLKSKGYSLQFQMIVDHKKRFIDIFVEMPRSMNDAKMLCLSSIYWKATWEELFNEYNSHKKSTHIWLWVSDILCLCGWWYHISKLVKGIMFYRLYSTKDFIGKELWLRITLIFWKKTFKELMIDFNLNVLFLLDVVIICCCINLHNMILNGKDVNIDELLV